MKRLWRVAGTVIAIGLMAYFLWFAWRNLDPRILATTLKQPGTLLALFLAILGYMTIYPVTGLAWRQLLLRQGQNRSATELTQLIGIAQLAKYIPGNIAQHASRATLALKRGIPLQGLASAFDKLAQLGGGDSSMFDSHPGSADRAAHIRQRIAAEQ